MITSADREEISALVQRYAHLVDRREVAAVADLFTDDAVLTLPDPPAALGPVRPYAGREEITRALWPLHDIPVTLHGILGLVIDADADDAGTAHGSVTGVAHHVTDRPHGTTANLVWYLRYADTYRRDNGRWRMAGRALQIDWIETRPVRHRRAPVTREDR
jgi:hypothetical protein